MPSDLMDWAAAHLEDARVKAIVGVRGANKTGALEAVRNLLRARGVDAARLVSIDFEDVRFRHLKTADDVLAFLHRLPGCSMPCYLFLDEISRVGAHAELLRRLHELSAWNVWVASSTAPPSARATRRFVRIRGFARSGSGRIRTFRARRANWSGSGARSSCATSPVA